MRLRRHVLVTIVVLSAALTAGCSDDGGKSEPRGSDASVKSGEKQPAEREDAATSRDADPEPRTDRTDGSTAPVDAGASKDATMPNPVVQLPAGSREHDGVVNLVDEAAAAQLETFLSSQQQTHVALREGLTQSVNVFLQHYSEIYDFLFIFTDHSLSITTVGKFETINVHAAPGGAAEIELAAGGYRSNGRLKGVIGIQWRTPVGPPLSHEFAHYWAAHLDARLGFGSQRSGRDPAHWGFTSVHGQLGGFDGSALRCLTPPGASPPNCTALASGRVQYAVTSFFPNSNPSVPYAPLELYLMGLLPKSEVPGTFQVLDEAELVAGSQVTATGMVTVEAAGIRNIAFADVVARHGEIQELPSKERQFRAAFIVASAQPASTEVLDDVAEWAAAFGNRGTSPVVTAFEKLTGGRATLDTKLGPRRPAADRVPEPRKALTCSVLAQDCPQPQLACYGVSVPICALSAHVAKGTTCDSEYACEAGLDCFATPANPDAFVCLPYCEPDDTSHAKACQTLCSSTFVRLSDSQQKTRGAFCAP